MARAFAFIHGRPNLSLAILLALLGLVTFKCQERFAPDPFGRL